MTGSKKSIEMVERKRCTVVWIKQEYRLKYWVTRLSVRSFARTSHLFACFALFASLAHSATLTRSLACSIRSLPRSRESELLSSQNDLVLSHSALVWKSKRMLAPRLRSKSRLKATIAFSLQSQRMQSSLQRYRDEERDQYWQ